MNFTEQLDLFLKKRLNSKFIQISVHTPAVLQEMGINDYPILMETRGLKKAFADKGNTGDNYHGLGIEAISRLPDILNSPTIVLNSLSHPRESVVIVADSLDKNGYPIVLPIKLNQKSNYNFVEIDSNVVMTAYGRASFGDFLKDNIAAQTIVFADKEKSQRLLDSGLQLPITLDSVAIIRPWNKNVNDLEQRISLMKAHKFFADGVYEQMLTDGIQMLMTKKENTMDETNTTEMDKITESRAKALRLVQETGEPYVTIEYSENSAFDSGDVLPLSVADKKFARLDAEHEGNGYDKVNLHIDYIKDGKPDSYEGCQYGIGDEQQGLVSHIQSFWQFYLDNKNWRKRLESEHSLDYVKSAYEEYERMAHDVASFLKRHVELAEMLERAQSVSDFTQEDIDKVRSHVSEQRAELNGTPAAVASVEHEKKDDVIERVTPKVSTSTDGVGKPHEPAPVSYRDKVTEIRDTMIQAILARIEKDPLNWTAGWNKVSGNPVNGKTDTAYRGLNSIYLYLMSEQHGYNDPRWVTFNQAKALGASIKKGEKSYPVLFYERYDKLTKKEYDPKTTKSMTEEERAEYERENVRFILKYYSVFNAQQCVNFPELDNSTLLMSEEERANQNELIETIIANSVAPINYDGGSRAYYQPSTDSIHLPAIENFHSMQDYYATALHEIAHSTGHESRLNRDLSGVFGSQSYAVEELRAELACVFMQIEHGITFEGNHINNHAAYVQSWLEAVKSDPTVFYKAVRDAGKIADYVDDNYLQAIVSDAKEEITEEIKADERTNVNKLEENVREWYTTTFPHDELGNDIDGGLSFGDVANALSKGENIYDVLGSDDSIVRERVFKRLAELQDKSFSNIYDAYMRELPDLNAGPQFESQPSIFEIPDDVPQQMHNTFCTDFGGEYQYFLVNDGLTIEDVCKAYALYPSENFGYELGQQIEEKQYKDIQSIGKGFNIDFLDDINAFTITQDGKVVDSGYLYEDLVLKYQEQIEQAQNTPRNRAIEPQERKREWFTVDLPEGSLGKRYGENTMVKMPVGEYSHYALFLPAKLVKTVEGKQQLRVASDFIYRLINDGRQVELTGQELRDSFAGMQIGKQYKRVAPSRMYAKTFADLERNVPEEMKVLPNWCVYRTFQREDKDKKGKVLKSAVTGEGASSKRKGDWTDFDTALKYARENGFAGVSFLLEAKNGITCVDLDECIVNAETGEMKERAAKLVESLKGTYMERSTSGNGVHIFLKDDILKGGRFRSTAVDAQKGDLEVYDDNRVISMTGNMFSDTNAMTRAGSAATVYMRAELGEQKHNNNVSAGARPRPASSLSLSDNELISRIRSSKKGRDFDYLYSGKGITGNKSNDDAKLAHLLLYFNEGDKDQAFRIMRESEANRPDKPDSYYRHTIDNMDKNIQEYAKHPSPFSGKDPHSPVGSRVNSKGSGAEV